MLFVLVTGVRHVGGRPNQCALHTGQKYDATLSAWNTKGTVKKVKAMWITISICYQFAQQHNGLELCVAELKGNVDYTAAESLKITTVAFVTEQMTSVSLVIIKGPEIGSIDATVALASRSTYTTYHIIKPLFKLYYTEFIIFAWWPAAAAVRAYLLELEYGSGRRCLPAAKEGAQHVQIHQKLRRAIRNYRQWKQQEGQQQLPQWQQSSWSNFMTLKSIMKCVLFCTVTLGEL